MADPLRKLILVLDDDAASADLLAELVDLSLEGCHSHAEYDGRSALDWALQHRPDAAVLDLEMPGMTGPAVATGLRQALGVHAPLLIAVSGNGDMVERLQDGPLFDCALRKPIKLPLLLAALGAP